TLSGAASGLPTQFELALTGAASLKFRAVSAINMLQYVNSPYLVYPGDTLVLSISKTRPFCYGTKAGGVFTSGSIADDVQLITGTVNITLFGSLLQEANQQPHVPALDVGSSAVHEAIVGA